MHLYATNIVRGASLADSGRVYKIDWDAQQIVKQIPAPQPIGTDAGPRGSRRGSRGICEWNGHIVVANYDTLFFYDRNLQLQSEVSHPLFSGLHEIWPCDEGIWVSSTGIEAVLLVDPVSGELRREWCALEERSLSGPPLNLPQKPLDRSIDYRQTLYSRGESITHTNCVYEHEGRVYATLSNCGAIVEVYPDVRIRVLEPTMGDPHNGICLWDGRFIINDTRAQTIRIFSPDGTQEKAIDLNKFPVRIKQGGKALKGLIPISIPGWLRGLTQIAPNRVIVGISPAALLEVDIENDMLVRHMKLSDDVNNSIFGVYAVRNS